MEMLVAAGLGLLLLSLLHRFLVPVIETSSRVSTQQQLTDQGIIALNLLSGELSESTSSSLSYKAAAPAEPMVFALTRRDGVAASGRKLWKKEASLYLWDSDSGALRHRVWPPAPPTLTVSPRADRPTLFSPTQLVTLSAVTARSKLLASDVKEFEPIVGWPATQTVTSRIVLDKNVAGIPNAHCELSKVTTFKN